MQYSTSLYLTIAFILLDIAATCLANTMHLDQQNEEDLMNIVMISLHGCIVMCSFFMIFVSVSRTIKFRAGLFGELFKLTWKPVLANAIHIGIMPMPWVFRRWILKGSGRKLYWDNVMYDLMVATNVVSLFFVVFNTAAFQVHLADPTNYDVALRPDRENHVPRPRWFFSNTKLRD
ncbi:hypothetical protein DIPPA_26274 [Diplonema papillatum]|nr:hypothetical protein DIPPA_26274 [Diplonema papillatum]